MPFIFFAIIVINVAAAFICEVDRQTAMRDTVCLLWTVKAAVGRPPDQKPKLRRTDTS